MKRKAFPVLLEQLVMVLVFAVAAAVCLRLFVAADRISRQSQTLDRAVIAAQTAAEVLKSGGRLESGAQDGLILKITPIPGEVSGLGKAEIAVFDDTGALIYTLTAAWQEVGP